ncbi:unnamed protein product [Schistosoma mattheei]|uniref:Uncharacterized protein n=1 Tax=Schistosoma mattheei TaxID=31246 RepID=A0A183NYF1_9TREM|nr:unnamed protein product [Schistosoma mattheei]
MIEGDAKVKSKVYCYHLSNTGSLNESCLCICNPPRVLLVTFKNKPIT